MGHGRCEVYAPGLFAVDDAGLAHFLDDHLEQERLDDVREAARNCPESAITVQPDA